MAWPKQDSESDATAKDLIESWYLERHYGKPSDRKTGVLHVSDLAYLPKKNPCHMRVLGYWIRGEQPYNNWPFSDWQNFQIGHAVHEMIQAQMVALIEGLAVETPAVLGDLAVEGTCDGFADRVVYEIKSSYAEANNPTYVAQSNMYAYILDADRCEVVVQQKAGVLSSYPADVDFEDVERMLEVAEEAVRDKAGPLPRRYEGYQCRTCPFRQACKPTGKTGSKRHILEL